MADSVQVLLIRTQLPDRFLWQLWDVSTDRLILFHWTMGQVLLDLLSQWTFEAVWTTSVHRLHCGIRAGV